MGGEGPDTQPLPPACKPNKHAHTTTRITTHLQHMRRRIRSCQMSHINTPLRITHPHALSRSTRPPARRRANWGPIFVLGSASRARVWMMHVTASAHESNVSLTLDARGEVYAVLVVLPQHD